MTPSDSLKCDLKMKSAGGRRLMATAGAEDTLAWISSQNLAQFRGMWIVAFRRKIRGRAETLEEALKDAALPEDAIPFVLRIPLEEKLAV